MIPFGFFGCDRGRSVLAPGSAISSSPLGAPPVGPLFALCGQKRTRTQSSIAGGNIQSCKENLILAEERPGVRERDQGSSTGTGGDQLSKEQQGGLICQRASLPAALKDLL